MKDLIEENKVQLITLAALIILPLFFLGMSGLKFMIVMAILYVLPVYLILTYFDIKQGERIFFSLFISLGLLSLGTFYLNLIIPSMRMSALVFWLILLAVFAFLKLKKKK